MNAKQNKSRETSFRKRLTPPRIALIYAVVGGLWILASDWLVLLVVRDPEAMTHMQTYKGWFYVLLTAWMLYWLVSSYGKRLLTAIDDLRKSEEQARLLIDSVTDYEILMLDPDGYITNWNIGAQHNKGYTREEAIGMHHEIFFTIRDVEHGIPNYELKMAAEQGRYEDQGWRVRKDGSVFWAEAVTTAIRDPSGGLRGFSKVIRDITGRRMAEEALKASESQFRSLVEQSPFSTIIFRPDGAIITVNEAFQSVWGGDREATEYLKKNYNILKDGLLEAAGLMPYVQKAFRGEFAEIPEFLYEPRKTMPIGFESMKTLWVRAYIYPVKNDVGTVQQVVLMHEDVTKRKLAETALEQSRKRTEFLADLLENSSQPFAVGHVEGGIELVNQAFSRLTGYSLGELMNVNWIRMLTPPELLSGEMKIIEELNRTGKPARYETEFLKRDGSRVPVELLTHVVKDEQGSIRHYYAFVTDISERKRAEEAQRVSEERYRIVAETAMDGIITINEENTIVFANPAVERIFGYAPRDLTGRALTLLMPERYREKHIEGMRRYIETGRKNLSWSMVELQGLHKDGGEIPVELSFGEFIKDERHFFTGIVRDISERKRAEETILYQTYHDFLTGLPNRVLFLDHLKHELAEMERIRTRLAVLFLDVDQFRNVNDSLGHNAGDALIRDVADRLQGGVRDLDTLARVGGDEFTILLPLIAQPSDVTRMTGGLMELFKKPFLISGHQIHVTASIGISLYPEDGENAETLLRNADIALHYAKDQGRNNFQFFNPAINYRTLERILFENRLRQALERQELVVHYQPQRNMKTGAITGVEALVRWNHPELGLLPPDRFVPLAEEIGVIIEIDQWVLRTACEQLKSWERAGWAPRYITTNLSARQFQQPGLADTIGNILKSTGLSPDRLGIEITETLAMHDTELTSRNLNELSSLGVRFLIDDFGTGYSSLSYLKKLPIHKLKIDKSFITHLGSDGDYQAIINAIIAMAHILKLEVVAEGVETEEQFAFLHARECDEMQGYQFSKPIPAGEFGKLLASAGSAGINMH